MNIFPGFGAGAPAEASTGHGAVLMRGQHKPGIRAGVRFGHGLLVFACLAQEPERSSFEAYEEVHARGIDALLTGKLEEGIAAFESCLERPESRRLRTMLAYHLACAHAQLAHRERAMDWLEKSVEWGWFDHSSELAWLLLDSDLRSLRDEPRFERLIANAVIPPSTSPPLPEVSIDWSGGHQRSVFDVAFDPAGERVATACADGSVRIWDALSEDLLARVAHDGPAHFCTWLDSGRRLLTLGKDNTLRIWDSRTGEPLDSLLGPSSSRISELSPDARYLIVPADSFVRCVDVAGRHAQELYLGHEVFGVAIGSGGALFATVGSDGSLRLFDGHTRRQLTSIRATVPLFGVAFRPDGRGLVTVGADGRLRELDLPNLRDVRSFQAHGAEINHVAFSPDGTRLLTSSVDRTARIWSTEGVLQVTLKGHTDEVFSGCFSPDGQKVLTGSADGSSRLWDANSGLSVRSLGGLKKLNGRTLSFSSDGMRLTTFDAKVREWELPGGREVEPQQDYPVLRFTNGGAGRQQQMIARCSSTTPGILSLEGTGGAMEAAFVSPGGRTVFTVGADDHGRIWNVASGKETRDLGMLSRDGGLTVLVGRWPSADFSPDGALLATAQHADNRPRVWDCETGEELDALPGDGFLSTCVAFAPSGEQLAAGFADRVDVFDLLARERVHSIAIRGKWPTCLAYRPDGKVLAAGTVRSEIRLLDPSSGACTRVLSTVFPCDVRALVFSPDGSRLAVAGDDHRVMLWDTERGVLLGTIVPGPEPGDWLTFSPSRHYLGQGEALARAQLVQGAITYPLGCFAAVLESPERVREALAGAPAEPPMLPTPPTLVVASPRQRTTVVSERSVTIEALATEPLAGLRGIEVSIDGEPYSMEGSTGALTLEDKERLARLELRLPLRTENSRTTITLQAVSARGIKSRAQTFQVHYEAPRRDLYLLALGVADYTRDTLDLSYPTRDVDGIVSLLEAQRGVLFDQVFVERRVDREVTSAEALRLRDEFLLRARPEDTLVVFVAGHGVRTETGEYWFLTSDATPERPYPGIKRADLESLVTWDKLHAAQRVLLLDTCHSGAEFGKGLRGERGIAFQQSEVDSMLESASGLYILAATSDEGFAREQAGNGLFTRALLDGLTGAADSGELGDKDGTVGINELMHYAYYAVLELSSGQQRPTFPKVEGGMNFPLARAR